MSACTCCFVDYIVKCTDTIHIFAKLELETTYNWVITDKFNRQYSGEFTTQADGFWQIPIEELPPGMLTEFSGEFMLQVFPTTGDCAPVQFKVMQVYDCITFTVQAGTREKNNLGCVF